MELPINNINSLIIEGIMTDFYDGVLNIIINIKDKHSLCYQYNLDKLMELDKAILTIKELNNLFRGDIQDFYVCRQLNNYYKLDIITNSLQKCLEQLKVVRFNGKS